MRSWKSIWIVVFLLLTHLGYGQQQVMFSQYMFNGLAINPAYAGSQEGVSFTALARKQWSGMDGSPQTESFAVHGPIQDRKIALGFLMVHDQIGVTNQYNFFGCYAYRLKLSTGTLSAGLQAGFQSYQSQFSKLLIKASDDPHFINTDISAIMPNVGAGLFYQTKRFYTGFSLPMLMNNSLPGSTSGLARQYRHWFLQAGYVLNLNQDLKLKPNILIKAVEGAPLQIDLNANLLVKEAVWLGASYRSKDALSALLELQATTQLRVGYAYDFGLTSLRQVHSGSHELMVNYRLWFDNSKIVTPRYF